MVFKAPSDDRPYTLRSCLTIRTPHTLTERLDLAKQMARSVNYVHTLDFVYKSVRPENMIGFFDGGGGGGGGVGTPNLASFFLIGFQQVRGIQSISYTQGDDAWEKNLYRHPARQRPHPEESYSMQHDIYSLWVCLLEIGLWNSFVTYDGDGNIGSPSPVLGLALAELQQKNASSVKRHLEALAKRELPGLMGDLYEQVVINCLTCLDEDNEGFGDVDKFDDTSGVLVGVRYIDKILIKLNSIVL